LLYLLDFANGSIVVDSKFDLIPRAGINPSSDDNDLAACLAPAGVLMKNKEGTNSVSQNKSHSPCPKQKEGDRKQRSYITPTQKYGSVWKRVIESLI